MILYGTFSEGNMKYIKFTLNVHNLINIIFLNLELNASLYRNCGKVTQASIVTLLSKATYIAFDTHFTNSFIPLELNS